MPLMINQNKTGFSGLPGHFIYAVTNYHTCRGGLFLIGYCRKYPTYLPGRFLLNFYKLFSMDLQLLERANQLAGALKKTQRFLDDARKAKERMTKRPAVISIWFYGDDSHFFGEFENNTVNHTIPINPDELIDMSIAYLEKKAVDITAELEAL